MEDFSSFTTEKKKKKVNPFLFYMNKSVFYPEIYKVGCFLLVLGGFEYFFFTYIICKLKFVNLGEILCFVVNEYFHS